MKTLATVPRPICVYVQTCRLNVIIFDSDKIVSLPSRLSHKYYNVIKDATRYGRLLPIAALGSRRHVNLKVSRARD